MVGLRQILGFSLVLALSACGGGDGGSSPTPPPAQNSQAPAPGTIAYSGPAAYNVRTGVDIVPTVTGTVANYSVAPALPTGLAIDSTSGRISGVPLAVTPAATYTVSALSAGTTITTTLSIDVKQELPDFYFEKNSWQDVKGIPSVPFAPVVSAGTVTTWTLDRALPAGLNFDAATGRVSGTPTAASPQQGYTLTGSNSGGAHSEVFAIWVKDTAPQVTYLETVHVLPKGKPAHIVPDNVSGNAVAWSVSPALPAGLSFNTATGEISGTPSTLSPETAYQVIASNPDASTYLSLSISVEDGTVLVDLGHADTVQSIRRDGQRMVSLDAGGHAVLWNAQSGAKLATRDGVRRESGSTYANLVDVAGDTAVMQTTNFLLLLDSATGAELAQVHTTSTLRWWQLARDGSYVVAATGDTLTAWSRTGSVLFTRSANYSGAKAFSAPGELRIGGGPAGGVIESITVPGGVSSSSATHQGAFHSWFEDGGKFFTNTGNTIWVYSANLAQLDTRAMPTLGVLTGQGNWFWTYRYPAAQIDVYAVGASSAPTATYPLSGNPNIIASNGTIGILPYGSTDVSIVDLSGGAPLKNDFTGPSYYFGAYAAADKDDWAVGAMLGVMLGEFTATPQLYSYGEAQDIDANANDIVVATASGHILDFDAQTRAVKRDIDYAASKVELSADGASVVAAPLYGSNLFSPVKNLRVYSLASGALLNEWTYPSSGITLRDFDVADAADVIAQVSNGLSGTPQRTVTTLSGTAIWSSSAIGGTNSMMLSPDGTQVVIQVETPPAGVGSANIYGNGTLSGAIPGGVAGWLDNTRLVVNRYVPYKTWFDFDHVDVMNATQSVLASFNVSTIGNIQPVTSNSFYSRSSNTIHDASTGATLFSSGDRERGRGAVSGTNVAYAAGAVVWLRPH